MKKYSCIVEGKTFETQEEVTQHILKEHEDLTGGSNTEAFIEVLHIEEENLGEDTETKETVIEETPEESPSEEGIVEEETMQDVVNYKDLSDTDRSLLMQKLFGSKKKVRRPLRVGHFNEDYTRRIAEKILMGSCPVCDVHWSKLSGVGPITISKEGVGKAKKLPDGPRRTWGDQVKGDKPFHRSDVLELKARLIIQHIKSQHVKIFQSLKDLWGFPKKMESVEPSPNPESTSATSKEDLSAILDDKVFIEKLSAKTEEGYPMSEGERERFLKLWMRSKGNR